MKKNQTALARRLIYLPLDIHEKILLWLAYKNLKPVSEIYILRRKQKNKSDSNNLKRIRQWIEDANMHIATESAESLSWHVGPDKNKVERSAKILHLFDYQHETESGLLFGFPIKSVKGYAHSRNPKPNKTIAMVGCGDLKYNNQYLKDKYYTPYIFYNLRQDTIKSDSQTAKKWADTIRQDIPLLAQWFEKQEKTKTKNRL
jgi:hypothetical protein